MNRQNRPRTADPRGATPGVGPGRTRFQNGERGRSALERDEWALAGEVAAGLDPYA